jgi:hypothetical protein
MDVRTTGWFLSLVALLGVVFLPTDSRAEIRKGEYLFGPYGLYSVPLDDYPAPKLDDVPYLDMGSDIEPGPGLALAIDRVMSSKLTIGGEFKFYFGTLDERVLQDYVNYHVYDLDEAEVTWRTIHFGARARYFLNGDQKVNPFIHAGVGVYINKLNAEFRQIRGSGSTNDFNRSESFTDPGLSFGPGLLYRITNDTRISADAILTNVFTSGRNVRYFAVSLGLVFGVTPE